MDIYPTSSIKRMSHRKPPAENQNAGHYEVELADGDSCRIAYTTAHDILRSNWQCFAAYPGCILLEEKEEQTGNDPFHRVAVLGWAMDEEGALRPLTAEGSTELRHWAILAPDGSVADQFGGMFPSEELYLESLHEEEDATHA